MTNRSPMRSLAPPAAIVLVLVLLAGLAQADDNKLPRVQWHSYHEAMAMGKSEDKPIFLHFSADWSRWCKAMRQETYTDFTVARYLNEHFVCGWIDAEDQRSLAKKYRVESFPTLWFVDSKGKSLTSVGGYLNPEKILLVLEFIQTKSYENTSYEAWKEKRLGR